MGRLLDATGRSGPTVLNFWASYCPPCLAEMPLFEALHRQGQAVLGVSLDADDPGKVQAILRARGVSYPNLILDPPSMKALGRALPQGLPFTLVLDAQRRPRVALFGKTSRAELRAALREASRALEADPSPGL